MRVVRKGLLVVALVAVLGICHALGQLQQVADLAPGYQLSWIINKDTQVITFQLRLQQSQPGWAGIGWHAIGSSDDLMTRADFALAIFNGSHVVVEDYFANQNNNGFARPLRDTTTPFPGGEDDILAYSGEQIPFEPTPGASAVLTLVTFQRRLVTGDTKADHPISAGQMKVIWAHGVQNQFGKHNPENAGQLLVDFFTGQTEVSVSDAQVLRQMHGGMMFIGFAIILTFGAFIPRFLRKNQWWFFIHVSVQILGVLTVISAFGIAIVMTKDAGEDHFQGTHPAFGLAIIIITFCLPIFTGILARFFFRGSTAKYKSIHNIAGYITLLLAYVEIFLGIRAYSALDVLKTPYYLMGVVLGLYFTIALVLEFTRLLDGVHLLSPLLPYPLQRYFLPHLRKRAPSPQDPLLPKSDD